MEILIICAAAFFTAILTFFSGFGLGTLLLPVFALFFPVKTAIAATAVVHLANNLFKGALIGRQADFRITLKFTFPAVIFAFLGAVLLNAFSDFPPLTRYTLAGEEIAIMPVKLVIGLLIGVFALFELVPKLREFSFPEKYVPFGGALSGFFGGLSGHQGALRTMFLIRLGMEKEAYVGTVVLSAIIIDITRLATYDLGPVFSQEPVLVVSGCVAALAGSLIGRKALKKVSMHFIENLVGGLLIAYSILMIAGMI